MLQKALDSSQSTRHTSLPLDAQNAISLMQAGNGSVGLPNVYKGAGRLLGDKVGVGARHVSAIYLFKEGLGGYLVYEGRHMGYGNEGS